MSDFNQQLRMHVYEHFVETSRAPSIAQCAEALQITADEVRRDFRQLADLSMLVLQADDEILMAEPFSAVPTAFNVDVNVQRYWANCMWDALGVAAALNKDAVVTTCCADCGDALEVVIENSAITSGAGLVHFAVPASEWWRDVVFT
ncbi:MAG: hypothetical protein DWQ07_08260 [Chloroflexi bacterium]|nr:MAG: hypothetical protein DWQ07_08260 [Chloroflexota bacterium]MBL1193296.1 hypothetical protein [Chloroflexota bacterium]NOH10588.1 hypothetical protein [Chloroflexota bacterium]